ncbi:DUF885 family protein [Nocardiopsis sp. N85]|uniref:DUF885 family protein n=1 Tax=Nocardiopsis sp. N85 TaxID=3029400 RepID=UPI00237F392B|nr:DUF885 family protein [Nocardiopsis sp. N85]MDE3719828.1 DUF885 family protein [Nocardiopsis sp. N85]
MSPHPENDELPLRLRALADLMPGAMREGAGMHEYDGRVADLSPTGVEAALANLGGARLDDPHDEAHLAAFEAGARYALGEALLYRANPLYHLAELDVSGYDRDYAPEAERARARDAHLTQWTQGVDNAIAALDRIPAPVARSLVGAVRGLAEGLAEDVPADVREIALAAHARLVAHVERAAVEGPEDAALGAEGLARLMGVGEAMEVDPAELADRARAERDRLRARLAEVVGRIAPGRDVMTVVRELTARGPNGERVLDSARRWTELSLEFTAERGLVPYDDGECRVDLSPPAHRWATAMMSWSGPWETDTPSFYYITPPDPSWGEAETREWLEMFSDTTLPAVSVHEVAPGHFSHGRALRRASGPVRRALHSMTFAEGWAHYAEEMVLEEGFGAYAAERSGVEGWTADHYEAGVWVEALIRVTRLSVALGMHTGTMTVEEAASLFSEDTPLQGPAALSEARRATFDPTYGRYTWGKLEILRLREEARETWGSGFSPGRFHKALLDLGSPPLGLIGTALERG